MDALALLRERGRIVTIERTDKSPGDIILRNSVYPAETVPGKPKLRVVKKGRAA